jgi:hypothetical protein
VGLGDSEFVCRGLLHLSIDQVVVRPVTTGSDVRFATIPRSGETPVSVGGTPTAIATCKVLLR